jgi:hypothetical protein
MRSKREMETFNRLMESLKKGQTHNVLVSSLNPKLIVDGYKRRIAAMGSNVELKTQVREHKTVDEWLQDLMNHASVPETKASVKDKYEALKIAFPELGTESIIHILVKITGKSRRTLYNWLELVQFCTDSSKHRIKRSKCDSCQYYKGYHEMENRANELEIKVAELNGQLMKLKSESKEQLKEELTNSQYEVEQIIALFLKKHSNKEIVNGGLIQDKLTV